MKETYYFSHDYNPQADPKIVKLLMKHGAAGYGVYWMIVEKLYQENGRLPTDYKALAFSVHEAPELVLSVATKFDLFYPTDSGKLFGSRSVDRRLTERREKSAKARESAFARHRNRDAALPGETSDRSANALRPHSERTASALLETKGKEKKSTTSVVLHAGGANGPVLVPVLIPPRQPTPSEAGADEEEARLMAMAYPCDGGYHGMRMGDLPVNYCAWVLEEVRAGRFTRIGPAVKKALELVVSRRAREGRAKPR